MTDGQTVVGGRYQLQEPVGRGGMAEVHRGLDLRLGRPVAVKLLSAALAADPIAQMRFRREAQAAASLNDPNIASVYDTGEDTDPATGISIPYIVMELVEGSTLRAMLDDGPLPTPEALRITARVLSALAHSHAAGIVHRDIKPANVMVTSAGVVKVMDFGIARAVDDTSSHLTQTSAVIGTAQYLSPEQARGEEVDLRSDLYSVGCLLFELVTGRTPFVGETSVSVAYQHVREAPVPPSALNPALPAELDAIVLHALAKDPAARYPSAPTMRSDVELLLDRLDAATVSTPLAAQSALAAAALEADATRVSGPPIAPPALAAVAVVPPPEEPEERRRSVVGRMLLAATVVLLVLGFGAFGLVRLLAPEGSSAAATVVVPAVVGSTRAEADAGVRSAGLAPRFREVRGKAGKTVGTVTKQNPAPGESIMSGAVVTLDVNVGPATATIPGNLVGKNIQDVQGELEQAGFTKVRPEPVPRPSDGTRADEVISLEPGAGKVVGLGEPIVVRYAAGSVDSSGSGTGGGGNGNGNGGGGNGNSGNGGSGNSSSGNSSGPDSTPSPRTSPTAQPSATETRTPSNPTTPEPSGPASSASTPPSQSAQPQPSSSASASATPSKKAKTNQASQPGKSDKPDKSAKPGKDSTKP